MTAAERAFVEAVARYCAAVDSGRPVCVVSRLEAVMLAQAAFGLGAGYTDDEVRHLVGVGMMRAEYLARVRDRREAASWN